MTQRKHQIPQSRQEKLHKKNRLNLVPREFCYRPCWLLQLSRPNSFELVGKYLFRKPTDDLWKALQVFGGLIGNNSVAEEKLLGGFAVDAAIEIVVLSYNSSF